MTRTILLADDSVTIQKVIELTFLEEDYQVVAVSSGDEALDKLTEISPDLVIADIHMPGNSGYDVSRRSKQLHPGAPVILLVGTFEPFDEAEAEASGADANLKKPFDSQELLELVGRLIGAAEPAPAAPAASPTIPAASPTMPAASSPWEVREPAAAGGGDPFPLAATAPAAGGDDVFHLAPEPEPEPEPEAAAEPEAFKPTWDLDLEPSPVGDEALDDDLVLVDDSPFSAFDADEGEPFRLDDDEEPPAAAAVEAEPEPAAAGEEEVEEDGTRYEPPEPDEPEPFAAAELVEAEAPIADLPAAAGPLSDEDVDRIARRLAEVLGDRVVREVAWEVIPDLAEVVIKDRLRELEGQID